MKANVSLRDNITWLLNQYRKELKIEKASEDANNDIINDFENIIIELEFALKVSKGEC